MELCHGENVMNVAEAKAIVLAKYPGAEIVRGSYRHVTIWSGFLHITPFWYDTVSEAWIDVAEKIQAEKAVKP